MKLIIEITLGNEAMQTPADAAMAISEAFDRYGCATDGTLAPFVHNAFTSGVIKDANGNRVGSWSVD